MAFLDLSLDAPEKPNKGLEGGACNRRSCQAEPANWYNHGSYAWYCDDCARDIGQDVVNLRHWNARWKPECGHDQFETREQIDARENAKTRSSTKEPEEMSSLHRLAAALCLSAGMGFPRGYTLRDPYDDDDMIRVSGRRERTRKSPSIIFAEPARAGFTSEQPLTKRQRRRIRGRSK